MHVLHPALLALVRLKVRAWLRQMRRRLRTPSGFLFGLIGALLTIAWFASVAFRSRLTSEPSLDPALAEGVARGTLAVFAFLVAATSLTHRGLYLPKDEIERLLSAPVTRPDLVRYRLVTNLGRSLLFALFMGLVVAPRMPVGGFGFAGAVLAMLTLPVFGQAVAILFGDAENRVGRLVKRVPVRVLRIAAAVVLWLVILVFVMGDDLFGDGGDAPPPPTSGDPPGAGLRGLGLGVSRLDFLARLVENPAFRAATLPFRPWSAVMAATDHASFWPALALAVLLSALIFEATARIPVDFRELSLATSADVARRLSRLRSGRGGIGGTEVHRRALGWHVPWIFGQRPFGAVAWLKCCAILRRARGTLLFAVFVVGLTTWMAVDLFAEPVGGALFLALLGTIYLASGLRFDFRGDLDVMEVVKAWPLAPWKLFLATLLPEVLVVSLLVGGAVSIRAGITGELPPGVVGVIAATPVVSLLWLALDNAVFLVAPVRFVPGQGSAMHHTGRTLVLVFLRMALLAAVVLCCALAGLAARLGAEAVGLAPEVGVAMGVAGSAATVVASIAAAVGFGGWALARFDVARERV